MTDDEQLVDRLKKNALGLGWKFPFFMPAVARATFRSDARVDTACVAVSGLIRMSPEFAATLSDLEMQFVIAHELMHLLMSHMSRRGNRDPRRWNIANDLLINRTLVNAAAHVGSGAFKMPSVGIIANEDQAQLTSEQLYNEIEDDPSISSDPLKVMVGAGCGPMPDTDENGNEVSLAEIEQAQRSWQEATVQAIFLGKNAGNVSSDVLVGALTIPEPKVRWAQLLRGALSRAIAEAGVDDVSWSRRSRRSTPTIILPGGITLRCRAAVVIDTSGSMSDAVLAQIIAETTSIVNQLRVPVFLVAHDHEVQEACWIRPGSRRTVSNNVNSRLKGRGGTSFDEAYARVGQEGRFAAMVHLTDGCVGKWPDAPPNVRRHVVALIGEGTSKELIPKTVSRVVEVEM